VTSCYPVRFWLSLFLTSAAVAAESPSAKPQSASIVVIPSKFDGVVVQTGNVKVTFADLHTEVWTRDGDSRDVRISRYGNVAWVHVPKETLDTRRMMIAGKDVLVVRLVSGKTRRFLPYRENVGIEDWQFSDQDKAVVIRSMGHHGPSSFVKYAIETGKIIDAVGPSYTPYNKLPSWAKPLVNPQDY
jgi:hypothetical protein